MSKAHSWWEEQADGRAQSPIREIQKLDDDAIPSPPTEELLTRRIHILGTGSIGTLVAHSLAILPNRPPITLMLHKPNLRTDFVKKSRRYVRLGTPHHDIVDEQSGFDIDVLRGSKDDPWWEYDPHREGMPREIKYPLTEQEQLDREEVYIYSLIVTVKASATVNALLSVKHRVDSRTTIVLMQNGMGQIDFLNKQVFTDPETRPTYMLGIVSHGAHMRGPFFVTHAGFGTIALGVYRDPDKYPFPPKGQETPPENISEDERKRLYPKDADLYSNVSSRYLLRTLTRSPVLACAAYPYMDLFQLQLEKLVANALINPLTALLDMKNGYMLGSLPLTRIQRLLLAEISLVIRSLPELEGIPNVRTRFSADRLEDYVNSMSEKTAENSSSMREDLRKVRETEIDFINGYIVRRGEEQGIKCVLNYLIVQQVKAKFTLLHKGAIQHMPDDLSAAVATQGEDEAILEEVEGRDVQRDTLRQPTEHIPFER